MRIRTQLTCRALLALAVAVSSGLAQAQWIWTPEIGRFVNLKRLPKETPELQLEHARSLLLKGQHRDALDETEKFVDFYADSEFAPENLMLRGEIKLSQGNSMAAAKEFQQLISSYPDSDIYARVIQKQYEVGDALYDQGLVEKEDGDRRKWYRLGVKWKPFGGGRPFKRAIDVYNMVIENQPFSDEAAEAQFKVGQCHFARDEFVEAAFEYQRVVEDYIDSSWVVDASYGLTQCYEKGSYDSVYDQGPSQLAINAIEEFKARFPEDHRLAQLSEVSGNMRERIAEQRLQSAEFYQRRLQHDSARTYYELLVEEFPDTQAAAKAQEWLGDNPGNVSALPARASRFMGR